MKADDVALALHGRWPVDRYLHLREATIDPGRQGSKIDVAVLACWKSLRYEIDAVEIKVSLSDFRNELESYYWTVTTDEGTHRFERREHARWHAEFDRIAWQRRETPLPIVRHAESNLDKSDEWRTIAHRFWIAAPAKVATRIHPLLPDGWGLLSIDGRGATPLAKPTVNKTPRQLGVPEMIGLIRCAADAGTNMRRRMFDQGARAANPMISDSAVFGLPGRPA